MFGFSKRKIKRPDTCPVPEEVRIWMESAFMLLVDFFGREQTLRRKVLIPHYNDFNVRYDGSEASAHKTLGVIAAQMEIPLDDIYLEFFYDAPGQMSSGGNDHTHSLFPVNRGKEHAAGLYWGRSDDGKYIISLAHSRLSQPENMVATLAHELAHVKLLGEKRMMRNDEHLTDFVTVLFGLGIFNANACFQTYSGLNYRGWQSMGYLKQMEWGYALALFAHLRGEQDPDWMEHLHMTIKGDFIQGQNFIRANPESLFQNGSDLPDGKFV